MPTNPKVTIVIDAENVAGAELKKLKRDINATAQAMTEAAKNADRLKTKGTDAFRKWGREVRATKASVRDLAIGSGALTAALGLGIKGAIASATSMERLRAGLAAVAGDSEKAEQQFSRLIEVAKLPGLGLEEAIKGSTNLQSVGISSEFAARLLEEVGNSLARVGAGRAELDGTIIGIRQMVSAGKVLQEELNQMTSRIPDLNKVLIQAFGSARAEDLQKMGVSVDQFLLVMLQGLTGLERVGNTTANALENMSDAFRQVQSRFGEVFLPLIKQALSSVSSFLDALLELSDTQVQLLSWTAAVTAGVSGLIFAVSGFVLILPNLIAGIKALGLALTFLTTNPISLTITAVGVLVALFGKLAFNSLAAKDAMDAFKAQDNELKQLVKTTEKLVGERKKLQEQDKAFSESGASVEALSESKIRQARIQDITQEINEQKKLQKILEDKKGLSHESIIAARQANRDELTRLEAQIPKAEKELARIDAIIKRTAADGRPALGIKVGGDTRLLDRPSAAKNLAKLEKERLATLKEISAANLILNPPDTTTSKPAIETGLEKRESQASIKARKQAETEKQKIVEHFTDARIRIQHAETSAEAEALQNRLQDYIKFELRKVSTANRAQAESLARDARFLATEQSKRLKAAEDITKTEQQAAEDRQQAIDDQAKKEVAAAQWIKNSRINFQLATEISALKTQKRAIARYKLTNKEILDANIELINNLQVLEQDIDTELASREKVEAERKASEERQQIREQYLEDFLDFEKQIARAEDTATLARLKKRIRYWEEDRDTRIALKQDEINKLIALEEAWREREIQLQFAETIKKQHEQSVRDHIKLERQREAETRRIAQSISDIIVRVPFDFIQATRERNREVSYLEEELRQLESETASERKYIMEDEYQTIAERNKNIRDLEKRSADERLAIEQDLAEARKSIFGGMVTSFIVDLGRLVQAEIQNRLAKNLTDTIFNVIGGRGGGGGGGALSSLSSLFGAGSAGGGGGALSSLSSFFGAGSTGSAIASTTAGLAAPVALGVVANRALGGGETNLAGSLLGEIGNSFLSSIFHDPVNDSMLFRRGQIQAGQLRTDSLKASSTLGRQQASDMSTAFSQGFRSQGQQPENIDVEVKLEVMPMVSGDFIKFIERKKQIETRRGLIPA